MKSKPRLLEKYEKEVVPQLIKELEIKNKMAVPKVTKVVINMGVGKNKEALEPLKKEMALITGQLPSVKKAKISIASFGVRAGMPVGLAVTLRGEKAYSFLDRLFSVVLPRLRDFRGLSLKSFDKVGNYTLGIYEHTVFPEVGLGKTAPHGMEITIVVNSRNKEKSKRLLELLGMPFEKENK
jgi:large subunit ribosomal protein L5